VNVNGKQESARHPWGIYVKLDRRTTAGPSRHVQWVLRGGLYTVWSHVADVSRLRSGQLRS
jgi:hypothetical protein